MSLDDALDRKRAARTVARELKVALAPITCTLATCRLPAFLRPTHQDAIARRIAREAAEAAEARAVA
jgi:hypothetical protein